MLSCIGSQTSDARLILVESFCKDPRNEHKCNSLEILENPWAAKPDILQDAVICIRTGVTKELEHRLQDSSEQVVTVQAIQPAREGLKPRIFEMHPTDYQLRLSAARF